MKRISLLCAAVAAAVFSMSAQKALVDEVKNETKGNSAAAQAGLAKIAPALTNPETAESAYAWFTAGQTAVNAYNHFLAMAGLSPQGLNDDQKATAGRDLNLAYDYLMHALPLDQMPDAKGKVKPKYTKDIYRLLRENYRDFMQAGIFLFEAEQYPEAIQAWDHYIELPSIPELAEAKIVADPDSAVGQMMYYQALALSYNNEPSRGVQRIYDAINSGFTPYEVYRNGLAIANQAHDSIAVANLARVGYEKFGTEDMVFINELINQRLEAGDADGSIALVNEALAAQPEPETKAQLYDILGMLDLQANRNSAAIANFDKAIAENPNFAKPYFDKARAVYLDAANQWDDATDAVRNADLLPKIREAIALFEKAYDLDEVNMSAIPDMLYRIYYQIEGEESPNTQKWHNM